MSKETYRCEWVRCCKPSCGSCPHGPYWYGYYREGKRVRKHYYGRCIPPGVSLPKKKVDWREGIFSSSTATAALAFRILGIDADSSYSATKARYKVLVKESHPDLGNGETDFKFFSCAYSYLVKLYNWK